MRCRICDSATVVRLPDVPCDRTPEMIGGPWWRCVECGSDSSEMRYEDVVGYYDDPVYAERMAGGLDPVALKSTYRANVEWFADYRRAVPDNTFLDVGHLAGTMLDLMAADGWAVHGFDIHERWRFGSHTTIAPTFHASRFPRRYAAVQARETLEHVDNWRHFIGELFAVTMPGGICQIQTPCPWWPLPEVEPLRICYQREHLQLFSPARLGYEFRRVGWHIEGIRLWDGGQDWMLRRPA